MDIDKIASRVAARTMKADSEWDNEQSSKDFEVSDLPLNIQHRIAQYFLPGAPIHNYAGTIYARCTGFRSSAKGRAHYDYQPADYANKCEPEKLEFEGYGDGLKAYHFGENHPLTKLLYDQFEDYFMQHQD